VNVQGDILGRLQDLSEEDRAWVVARLPAQAKEKLRDERSGAARKDAMRSSVAVRKQKETVASEVALDLLARAEPQSLAAVLEHEPVWITAALIQIRDWPWTVQLLEALSPLVRTQVMDAQRAARTCTPLMAATLARLVASRIAHSTLPRASKFETLVERVRAARSKKRLSLHL
jgi:hypothetical protein